MNVGPPSTPTPSYLDERRAGPRPRTTATNPHIQLDQNAPPSLQEQLFARVRALPNVDRVIDNGWAERHPLAGRFGLPDNVVMVYGPRDGHELEVVAALVQASHAYACAAAETGVWPR